MTIRQETRPLDGESVVRKAAREAKRLAGILQATMSLEAQRFGWPRAPSDQARDVSSPPLHAKQSASP